MSASPPDGPGLPSRGEGAQPQTLFSRRRLRLVYLLVLAVATVLLAYRLREALNPLLISLLFAYMLNPVVRFLERRARMPRTAAILLIYAGVICGVAAASVYSIGKTAVGLDKLMTKITGGWQYAPSETVIERAGSPAPSGDERAGGRPTATASGGSAAGSPGASPEATTAVAEVGPLVPRAGRARRIEGLPVYGDGEIARIPGSPVLGFIDINGNGTYDLSEPEFTRETGRWQPTRRCAAFVRRVPGYLDDIRLELEESLPSLIGRQELGALADQVQSASSTLAALGAGLWGWVTENLFGGIARIALYLVLVPVYTFFLLRGFDEIVREVRGLLPGLHRDRIESIGARIDRAVAAFFRGRVLICIGKGAITAIGLSLVGVDFAVTIGIVAGVLSIVPAVGPISGFLLAVVCSYGPDGGWVARIVGSGVVFVVAEGLEGIANPVLLGREVGLHPVTLLVALFLFGDLFGLFGVLLAVPLAAIVKILCVEFVLPELRHLAAETRGTEVSGFFTVPAHLEEAGEAAAPPRQPRP
jgi:predicted PurR-regulated permease PerM